MAERQKGDGPRARGDPVGGARARSPRSCAQLPVELIAPNPHQPRRTFDEDALLALAESIQRPRRAPAGPRPPARRAAATS